MGTRTARITQLGAILAISSIALVGCSSSTINDPAPSSKASSSSAPKSTEKATKKATVEGAADFANIFFSTLLDQSNTGYKDKTPPVQLTDEQASQLFLDGKVDGVSDEKLEELVKFLYENHPLGKDIYFAKGAPIQERLQVISALILAQQYAGEAKTDQTPTKITSDDVTLDESGSLPRASIANSNEELAPVLVFVDGKWMIDGEELLKSFGVGGDATAAPTPGATETPSAG